MQQQTPQTIYDLLDIVRTRPALYLGYQPSLSGLMSFLSGYELAYSYNNIRFDEGSPPYWHFTHWVPHRLFGESNTVPWLRMSEELGDAKAFFKFYELLDEFRRYQQKLFANIQLTEHHQPTDLIRAYQDGNFYITTESFGDGVSTEGTPRTVPSKITIYGYPNASLCFMRYEYPDKILEEGQYSSLKRAMERVRVEFNIYPQEWHSVQ